MFSLLLASPVKEIRTIKQKKYHNNRNEQRIGLSCNPIEFLIPLERTLNKIKVSLKSNHYNETVKLENCIKKTDLKIKYENYTDQRLFLCNEHNFPLNEFSLNDFLNLDNPDIESFRNCLISAFNNIAQKSIIETPLMSINRYTNKNIRTDLSPKHGVKAISIRCKLQIYNKIAKVFSGSYFDNMKVLNNNLEAMIDRNNDVIVKINKYNLKELIPQVQNNNLRKSKNISIGPLKNTDSFECIKKTKKKIIVNSTKKKNDLKIIIRTNLQNEKPPTKIKIIHKEMDTLSKHEVNIAFDYVNTFVTLTFKNKSKVFDNEKIMKLAHIMKLPLKFQTIDTYGFNSRELIHEVRDQINSYLASVINHSNCFEPIKINQKTFQYKSYIKSSNNGILIRNAFGYRWWWTHGAKCDEVPNFIWTQWAKRKHISKLSMFGRTSENEIPKE